MSSLDDDVSTCVVCGGGGRDVKLSNEMCTSYAQNSCINDKVAMDRQATRKCRSKKKKISSRRSLLYTIYFMITCFSLIPSSTSATQVKWQPNNNVKPENQAAHNAPRSQKYWNENNIKRPDYAKTDAEVYAERAENGGSGGGSLFGIFLKVSIGIVLLAIVYARITGDWNSILNNPVGSYIDCINWLLELIGMKGNRLGSSSTEEQTMSSIEARRLARLARFDSPKKNMLDDMKAD